MTDLSAGGVSLPDLRIVPVNALVPHERHDEHRMGPLGERMRAQGVLRNPPVVTSLPAPGHERYVVLDGANRTAAAVQAGLSHVAVQVVRYEEPDVRLLTWNHVLAGIRADEAADLLGSVNGVSCRVEHAAHARALVARREILAYVALPDRGALALSAPGDFADRNRALHAVVERYRDAARVYRIAQESFEAAQERVPEAGAMVVFPRYAPAEILELASTGERLPAGITRHLIAWRALRLNLPLAQLADPERSREEKQAWLRSWMRERLQRGQVRFYEESTVLFDE